MTEQADITEKEVFNSESVGLILTGLYPSWKPVSERIEETNDTIRGDIALETFQSAINEGYSVSSVVDAGSSDEFIQMVKEMGLSVARFENYESEPPMSAQRRQAIQELSKMDQVKAICWLEPEKTDLIRFLPQLTQPIIEGTADIVIPKRTASSMQTYPEYQRDYENRSNSDWNSIMRRQGVLKEDQADLDVWFGPRVIKNDPEIIDIFLNRYRMRETGRKLDKAEVAELWPNFLFLPVIEALHRGKNVIGTQEIDYHHPDTMTNFEHNNGAMDRKRELQRKNILLSSIHMTYLLKKDPRCRLEKYYN